MAGEKLRLVESSSLPVLHVDGIGKVWMAGACLRIEWYALQNVQGERIALPNLEMIWPIAHWRPGYFRAMAEAVIAEEARAATAEGSHAIAVRH